VASIFNTELEPSRICLGTASFGSDIPKDLSFSVLDAYVEDGGNFIDTAHIYAAWREGYWGASERTLGDWLASRACRDEVILATKGGHPPLDAIDQGRCGPAELEQDLNESLERLRVDHVDVYWLHRDEPDRPAGEIVETLSGFVRDGRIRSYGGSNWTCARLDEANAYASAHDLPPFVASQSGWSLVDRASPDPPVPGMLFLDKTDVVWHRANRFPLVAYTAQAKGYFSVENVAWARLGFSGPIPHGEEYDSAEGRKRLMAALALADMKGCTANQIALAFLLHQPFPVYPVVGTSRVDHVRESLESAAVPLSAQDMQVLTDK
jgi:aryl-alcohol dehydrogenase-like predicted oxidoreductase